MDLKQSMSVPLEVKSMDPNLTSRQRRNLTCMHGVGIHSFEYYYTGPHSHDVVIQCDLYLEKSSVMNNRNGQKSLLEMVSREVASSTQPDRCYEVFGVLTAFFSHDELRLSQYVKLEDWPTLRTLLTSCELFAEIFANTPLCALTSCYFRLDPKGDDGIDKLEVCIIMM